MARTEEEIERLRPTWEAFQGDVVMTDLRTTRRSSGTTPAPTRRTWSSSSATASRERMALGMLQNFELACKVGYKTVYKPRVRALTVVYRGFLGPDAEAEAPRSSSRRCSGAVDRRADVVYLPNLAMDSPFYTQP